MNVKNRLQKLEDSQMANAEYCSCHGGIVNLTVGPDWEHSEDEHLRQIAEAQKVTICDQCKRPIEKRLIIITGVEGNDGLSKAFPGAIRATFNIKTKRDE